MAYFLSGGDNWYVVGDSTPYDYEDHAVVADQRFHDDPEGYSADRVSQGLPAVFAGHRASWTGRIGGQRKPCRCSNRRWTTWRILGTLAGVAMFFGSLVHLYLYDVELLAFFGMWMGWSLFKYAVPNDPDIWVDQRGQLYYAPRHAGEGPSGPLR